MADFKALCAELLDKYDLEWRARERIKAALAEPEPPADGEVEELVAGELVRQLRTKAATEKANRCHYSAALLTRAANLLSGPAPQPVADGPAVSDDREPASVIPQLTDQLHRRATILLIRKVIDRAIRDTASVHWRVADTGEQLVRASDLLAWVEHMEQQMEQLDD